MPHLHVASLSSNTLPPPPNSNNRFFKNYRLEGEKKSIFLHKKYNY